MKTFIFYWLGGKIDVFKGESVADAFAKAGYGGGSVNALDFTEEKNYPTYKWDKKNQAFVKRSPYELFCARNKRDAKDEIIHRARCVLGLRGFSEKELATTLINTTKIYYLEGMPSDNFSNDELAQYARDVANDTVYWM